MENSKFAEIYWEYNYPEDYDEDEDDYYYNEGAYGKLIISLNNPELYIITDEGENSNIHDYVGIVISKLKDKEGPYTIEDIESDDIVEALSEQYAEDCREPGAFVSMWVNYVDIEGEHKIVEPSEKLKQMEIPGTSFFRLLSKMFN